MGNQNPNSASNQQTGADDLDPVLDAALAKYSTAEPRTGLEDRILANLRAERVAIPDHGWWKWSVAAAAIFVVVAVIWAWRSDRPFRPAIATHPSTATPQQQAGTKVASRDLNPGQPNKAAPIRRAGVHPPQANATQAAIPKLDQFPSRQPLSAQELALARYVSNFPQEASLIAKLQEDYEKEIQRQMKTVRSETEFSDSEKQER
jgi:hypothetical protein